MNVKETASTPIESTGPGKASSQEHAPISPTSSSYQMILDYHVSEILLTTIIIGVVLLLRLHHQD